MSSSAAGDAGWGPSAGQWALVTGYLAVSFAAFLLFEQSPEGDPGVFLTFVLPLLALLAHVVLGAVVRHAWTLVLPLVLGFAISAAVYDEDALGVLAGPFASFYCMVAIAIGLIVGRLVVRRPRTER